MNHPKGAFSCLPGALNIPASSFQDRNSRPLNDGLSKFWSAAPKIWSIFATGNLTRALSLPHHFHLPNTADLNLGTRHRHHLPHLPFCYFRQFLLLWSSLYRPPCAGSPPLCLCLAVISDFRFRSSRGSPSSFPSSMSPVNHPEPLNSRQPWPGRR